MRRQKTITVHGEKIKIVSRVGHCGMPFVRTTINGSKYFINFEIMKDYKITADHKAVYEEFIKRAMDDAFIQWVKEHSGKEEDQL